MSEDINRIIEKAEELCTLCEEEEAEELIREELKSRPKDLDLKTELAIILSRRGFDQRTESILKDVLTTDPSHERATSALGNLLGNSLRTEDAEELFKAYLEKYPHGHIVLDDYSRLLYDSDRVDEALNLGRKHISNYPQELAAYDALKYVLEMQEDDLASELSDDPDDLTRLMRYLENLAEQYLVLTKMMNCETVVNCASDELSDDIGEDMQRVVAEIREIRNQYNYDERNLAKSLLEKIREILSVTDE
ncbi:MAG: tetratricopeptide repeat protein [Candidatus Thorarchaeota archaeon]